MLVGGSNGQLVWKAAERILHHRGIALLLRVLSGEVRTSELFCCTLDTLEVLCIEPEALKEILVYNWQQVGSENTTIATTTTATTTTTNNNNTNANSSLISGSGLNIILKCAYGATNRYKVPYEYVIMIFI